MTKDVVLTWLFCLSVLGFLAFAGISGGGHRATSVDDDYFGSTTFRPSR
ncbi:hypothetical protein [Rhizobium sp. S163]|nr:hypothetical protein [Rhizobium sp. S163]MDM9644528.1 hypothetical protein [Rhizobium sp. S163]